MIQILQMLVFFPASIVICGSEKQLPSGEKINSIILEFFYKKNNSITLLFGALTLVLLRPYIYGFKQIHVIRYYVTESR